MHHEFETVSLINRLERVEVKVGNIEDKINVLLEQGEVTQENVSALTDTLHEQRDHFHIMRQTLVSELSKYRRVFGIGSLGLVVLLMWILLRI